jgi:hypothetical protein
MKLKTGWKKVVAVALIVCFTAAPMSSYAAIYRTTYFNIIYDNATEYGWARSLATYLNEAFRAARTVVGYDSRKGAITIDFYNKKDGYGGYIYGGQQTIYLNRYYFSTYAKWGATVAHETAHILFYNYTNAHYWGSSLLHYRTFLTEALSWYTGDVVYRYGSRYSESTVKANLKYYTNQTGYYMSWYGAGYYYRNGSGASLVQSIWMMDAIGYFLTGGLTSSSSSKVRSLLTSLRNQASSLQGGSASAFESAFKTAYGYYANSAWQYTGTSDFKNTSYLYGQWWKRFYN